MRAAGMNEISLNLPVIWKWGKRVGFSVLDQGMFSGANFLLNILLARWLKPEEYGAFAVAYAVMLFTAGFHYALVLDPLAVHGALQSDAVRFDYLKKSFQIQLGFSFFLGLVIIFVGSVLAHPLQLAVVGIGICTPFVLSMIFLRNSYYIYSQPNKAAVVSLIFFSIIAISMILLKYTKILEFQHSFWILAAGSTLSLTYGILDYRRTYNDEGEKIDYLHILTENWNYGKWIVLTAVWNGVTTLSYPILIGTLVGLPDSAAFKGWQNIITPMYQFIAAGTLLVVPRLSREISTHGVSAKFINGLFLGTIIPTILYILLIGLTANQFITAIYDQKFYLQYSWLASLFLLNLLLLALNSYFSIFIRAIKLPKYISNAKFLATIGYLVFMLFLWSRPQLSTVMVMLLSVTSMETIALFFYFLKVRKDSAWGQAPNRNISL